ncbi:pentatricopeptide repeat-containing protein-like isoform X1 [Salvia divinorum]|uniref:Pentatricopeptide repeat-containing protein-like isoform X1 n=1 Tax=Salvia divinorum TaxID=28513 RepID=A0ABD1HBS8_SALDI
MAAALRILRAKYNSAVTGGHRCFQFTRLLTIQHDSSSSYESSTEIPLLQKLLKAPLSTIKSTLDSEFSSDAAEFPGAALLSSLNTSAPQKAYLIIEWKLENLRNDDAKDLTRYARLISLCGIIKNLHLALLVFSSMEEQGIIPASPVFNALISTSLSSGNLITALSLFEIMEGSESYKPDEDSYNAFISAYASMGNKTAAEDWFKAKMGAGFPADARAYCSLVHCCIKLRAYEDARRYFEEMMFEGVLPNESSVVQDVLLMYCHQRNSQKVKEVLKYVRWRIDLNVCKKVVDLYRELGLAGDLEDLVVALSESGQSSEARSVVHCSLMRMYADRDRLDDVEYCVGRMLKDGVSFSCDEDVEKVICCYFRREAYDRLDMFLERMKQHSYKLTKTAYDLLGAGYRRAGMLEKTNDVVSEMKRTGFA